MGRTPGAKNYDRSIARDFAREIVESDEYRDNLFKRATTGTLAPGVEVVLLYYAYGKPVDTVALEPPASVTKVVREIVDVAERKIAASVEDDGLAQVENEDPDEQPGVH